MFKYGDHLSYYSVCEPCQRVIEVKDAVWAEEEYRAPGKLNYQLVSVLQASGCPVESFLEVEWQYRQTLKESIQSSHGVQDLLPAIRLNESPSESDLCSRIGRSHRIKWDNHRKLIRTLWEAVGQESHRKNTGKP